MTKSHSTTPYYVVTSPNRAGVAEPRLKIWDKNLGQTDGQTDRQTDETRHRVALQLKTVSMYFLYSITNNIFWSFCILYNIIEQFYFLNV